MFYFFFREHVKITNILYINPCEYNKVLYNLNMDKLLIAFLKIFFELMFLRFFIPVPEC